MSGDMTARDVIARTRFELHNWTGSLPEWSLVYADKVLAALAAAGWRLERDDQWEWGVIAQGDKVPYWCMTEQSARGVAANLPGQLVRRRPAGEREVVP